MKATRTNKTTPTRSTRSSSDLSSLTPSGTTLFIVESPTKVRTIEKYLGSNYIVAASYGHIADIPSQQGNVNIADDFAATYELSSKGRDVINSLKELMKNCSEVVLATDADREGEQIAAHLFEFLAPTVPVKRVTFHAVTKQGIEDALKNPRDIDWNLVAAARTRRILDRLFGFEVSDITRRKVRGDLSAGRVQSPALRLVVEREYERMQFVAATYADVVAESDTNPAFVATMRKVNGQPIAAGKDFDSTGRCISDVLVVDESIANEIANELTSLIVKDISEKPTTRQPQPPFVMSSLYQDAFSRLGMSMREAESVANVLFDKGLITYPRTDNPVHDPSSRRDIRAVVSQLFGAEMLAPYERYTTSKKKSQGAHEAIRPTRLDVQRPAGLTDRQRSMYNLIWQRTVASQMVEAKGVTRSISLVSNVSVGEVEFAVAGTTYHQLGFRTVYAPLTGDTSGAATLPEMVVGEIVPLSSVAARVHHTTAPPRFNDGSLVKELEELGIGRPSTYAPIIAKLRERYVWNKPGDRALIPTVGAFAVHRLLMQNFEGLLDYEFTSKLEEKLDEVAVDGERRRTVLEEFYFGNGDNSGLQSLLADAQQNVKGQDLFALSLGAHPDTGDEIILRAGKLFKKTPSPYIQCGDITLSIPDHTDCAELSPESVLALFGTNEPRLLGHLREVPVYIRVRTGSTYVQWGEKGVLPPGEKKPKFIGLLSTMTYDSLTFDEAVELLSLPRIVGHSEGGDEISLTLGKFGAYIRCGAETRSLKDDSRVFDLTEDEARELLKTPKSPRRPRGKRSRTS